MKVYRYITGKDDNAFCHRITKALNDGFDLYGDPTLAFDSVLGHIVCGQVITKEVEDVDYSPSLDLSSIQ